LRETHGKRRTVGVYERFLELPVAVVFAVLWLVGVVLEGLCVLLVLQLAGLALLWALVARIH
jgi:hypothetical protein